MTDLYDEFFAAARDRLAALHREAQPAVRAAAQLVVDTFRNGRRTRVFGSGHSALLAQDLCLRAGGLTLFTPLLVAGLLPSDYPYLRGVLLERLPGIAAAALDTADVEAGDCLLVVSNSGRNAVPVEMAVEARARGLSVIAVTGFATAATEPSRHDSGAHLHDVADVVIDTHTPHGDAAVAVAGLPARVGPLSTILGSAVLHALSATVAQLLLEGGVTPPVITSANVDHDPGSSTG